MNRVCFEGRSTYWRKPHWCPSPVIRHHVHIATIISDLRKAEVSYLCMWILQLESQVVGIGLTKGLGRRRCVTKESFRTY